MKKILFILSFVIAFTSLSPAMIFADEEITYGPFTINPRSVFETQEQLSTLVERENAVFENEFRDVIDDNSQVIYDGFVENFDNLIANKNVTLNIGSNSKYKYNADTLSLDIYYALGALDFDKMDFYWLNIGSMTYMCTGSGRNTKLIINLSQKADNFYINAYSSADEIKNDISQMNSVVNELTAQVADKSTYEKVLAFNDYLVKHNEYNRYISSGNYSSASSLAYEPVSSLVYGSTDFSNDKNPVCEGYSRGMKMLCDKANIPCILVSGNAHMWNAIKMDDGNWYSLDSTFNDPVTNGTISSEYLESIKDRYTLVGTDSVISNEVFTKRHTPEDGFLVYGASVCTYPKFSKESFDDLYHYDLLLNKVLNDDFTLSQNIKANDKDNDNTYTATDIVYELLNK